MFIPNQFGMLSRRTERRNINSEFEFEAATRVPCAIVHEKRKNQKTPVRADSSASRGSAEEKVATTKILFPSEVLVRTNDRFEINGMALRAVAVEQRFTVFGSLDHYEVDFDVFPV